MLSFWLWRPIGPSSFRTEELPSGGALTGLSGPRRRDNLPDIHRGSDRKLAVDFFVVGPSAFSFTISGSLSQEELRNCRYRFTARFRN